MYFTVLLLLSCNLLNIASGQDLCNLSRRNRTKCEGLDTALGDDRVHGKPSQCRVGCEKFFHPDIVMSTVSANCSFDLCDLERPFSTFDHDTRMCQPRTLCIRACGEEPAGCVYSGTCREFTCFKETGTGRPANFSRLTFSGPRSIVQVNNSKTSDNTTLYNAVDAVLISGDSCPDGGDERLRIYDDDCEPLSNRTFLSDNLPRDTEPVFQCRTLCRNARHNDVEIVRMRTNCGTCNMRNDTYVCDTPSGCIDQCRTSFSETAGCVFTGSCRSMICLSGIDSRLPAVLNVSDELGLNGAIVSVDNDADPMERDPPVFINYLADVEVPNSTKIQGNSDNKPEPDMGDNTPEPPMGDNTPEPPVGGNTPETESGKNAVTESASKWPWLGPIVGLFGAILTAIAALVAAKITYHGNNVMLASGKHGLFHADDETESTFHRVRHDAK